MWKASTLLIASVLILATLGIVMLASTSGIQAEENFGDPNYYVKKQALWLIIAIVVGIFVARFVDYHYLYRLAIPFAVLVLILLVLVFVPGLGVTVKGSTRWLDFGVANFQPSELAKLGVIIWLAWWMSRLQRWADTFLRGFLLPLIYPGVVCLLIIIEPDFGSVLLIAGVSLGIVFLGGAQLGYLSVLTMTGFAGFLFLVMQDDVRRRRVMAFLNPEKYAKREAFQLLQAKYAFITGGAMGVGLGESIQKRFYLPEAHTDFIFAIIGEELGAGATISVLGLYLIIFACGIIISLKAPDLFGKLLGFGITVMLTLQALLNIGVVTGCLPTKGIPLPLISFGGSSMLITFVMIGILLNIASHADTGHTDEDTSYIKDRNHWI